MEVQRSVGHQQTNGSTMCESTQRSCEPRRKKMDERSAPSEMARIITDPATGKCYCRGKVLGKVAQAFHRFFFSLKTFFFPPWDLPNPKTKHVNSVVPFSREDLLNVMR